MLKVGDKVRGVAASVWRDIRGREGVVIGKSKFSDRSNPLYEVDFGKGFNGHDGDAGGNIVSTRWYVNVDDVEKINAGEMVLGTPTLANDLRLPPQARKILAHLLAGKPISPIKSRTVYGIERLSDCILKIRRAGYDVVTENMEDEAGHKYGQYSLVPCRG